MLLIKLLPAFLLIELISSLSIVEDKVLNNHLMEVFGDYTDEIKDDIVKIKESSASAESSKDEKRFVSIIAPVQSRADHYWTRKRGREKATTSGRSDEVLYTWYSSPPWSLSTRRSKRHRESEPLTTPDSFNKVYSRLRRRIEIDDPNAQGRENETSISTTSPFTTTVKAKTTSTPVQPSRTL